MSDTPNKKIAHRILKMLARAEDDAASENEARVAKAKAEKLMAEHGITRADLDHIDFEYREVQLPFKQAPSWYRQVNIGLKKLFGLFTVYSSGNRRHDGKARYKVTGDPSDIEQYEYLLEAIRNQIDNLCADWRDQYEEDNGQRPPRKYSNDFRNACARRVQERLVDMVESVSERQKKEAEAVAARDDATTDMVLLKREEVEQKREKAQELMSKHTSWRSNTIRGARHNPGSRAGEKAGDNVRLNRGMSNGHDKRLNE